MSDDPSQSDETPATLDVRQFQHLVHDNVGIGPEHVTTRTFVAAFIPRSSPIPMTGADDEPLDPLSARRQPSQHIHIRGVWYRAGGSGGCGTDGIVLRSLYRRAIGGETRTLCLSLMPVVRPVGHATGG
jgi:hypothetical protein